MEFLVVDEGRFSGNRNVPLCDVVSVRTAKTLFGLDRCLVIEYGAGNIVAVQPDNERAFREEVGRRVKREE